MIFLLGCWSGPSPAVHVGLTATEVYDVPPPPDQRTLQLSGALPKPLELGSTVHIRHHQQTTPADVVDQEPGSLTVYVPADRAEAILDATGSLTLD